MLRGTPCNCAETAVVRVDGNGQPVGLIRPNDLVIFFNYRNDRAKELTVVLTQEDMPAEGYNQVRDIFHSFTNTFPAVCSFYNSIISMKQSMHI